MSKKKPIRGIQHQVQKSFEMNANKLMPYMMAVC